MALRRLFDFFKVGGQLVQAEQFTRCEEVVLNGGASGGIDWPNECLPITVGDGQDVLIRDGFIVEQVRAMTGDQNLGRARGGFQPIPQDPGGTGMESDFRFFEVPPLED